MTTRSDTTRDGLPVSAEKPLRRPTLRLVSLAAAFAIAIGLWTLLSGCQSYQPPCVECSIGLQHARTAS